MELSKLHIQSVATILLITLHLTTSNKPNARPVYEVINEQARIDDKIRISNGPGVLPYGNPLAGNSQQNARLHASNQQAMFNAERIRQHRAQLQRWTKEPKIQDSYMKAYHESQESHQLALEQQQATLRDTPVTKAPARTQTRPKQRIVQKKRIIQNSAENLSRTQNGPSTPATRAQSQRQELPKRSPANLRPELTRITKADAVIKDMRNRNHRSYGSSNYHQYLEPKRYKTVYVSPAPTYDQGVTIKPNGNIGLTNIQAKEPSKLYTEAITIDTKYVYPKQFSNMHSFKSVQDIEALNSLLKKSPVEQLSEFNALLHSDKSTDDTEKQVPIDLYFYLKDPTTQTLSEHYDNAQYAQLPTSYASAYMPEYTIRDHTPITEEVDDIEDPNKDTRPKAFGLQPVYPTKAAEDEKTTKINNYYKSEVGSQTITEGNESSQIKEEYYLKQQNDPSYEALHYGYEPSYYKTESDDSKSERYLHHNIQPTGVQHLAEDGTEISAYGSENLHYAANYEFGYRVRDVDSGNYFGHHEAKKGESTKGNYHVLLPDGRIQQVKYSAGPEGFHADISYEHLQ